MESSQKRLASLSSHLETNPTLNYNKITAQSDDDIVIIGMARTAMTKAKRGN